MSCTCRLCDSNGISLRCACEACANCGACARLSVLAVQHVRCRAHGAQPTASARDCPRCAELGRPCRAHLPSQSPKPAATATPPAESARAATLPSQSPMFHAPPDEKVLQHALRGLVVTLESVERFERTARYGNGLRGWLSDADGSHREDEVTRAREDESLAELLQVESEDDVRWPMAAAARDRFLNALMATELEGDRPERDPNWEKAREIQRRLRELESDAGTAIPAAVLRMLVATATAQSVLEEICDRVGQAFASPALRDRWAADAAPKVSAAKTPGRPKKDRARATPTIGRLALGRELVMWALAVWEGKPFDPPAWVPEEYRPKPEEKVA